MMRATALGLLMLLTAMTVRAETGTIRIGSKTFTEQQILAEIAAQLIERHTDLRVERRLGLGGTGICHEALLGGELDLYIEYTGTALMDILRESPGMSPNSIYGHVSRRYREAFELVWLPPLGINNTFAIAVRSGDAAERGWRRISDMLPDAADLTAGFTGEFIERPDGYPGLQRTYGLTFGRVLDVDPGLMYDAVKSGQVDVICAFATDSRIRTYDLTILEDDRAFFPPYDAAPVIRRDTLHAYPELLDALLPLSGSLDEATMQELNAAVDQRGLRPARVAADWIARFEGDAAPAHRRAEAHEKTAHPSGFFSQLIARRAELARKTGEHLALTGIAMFLSILLGVPLGILIQRRKWLAPAILGVAETIQTIPSLAMLAFLFALYRVLGAVPAVTALVLYALLPIILNTFTGIEGIPRGTRQAAIGLGLSGWQRLRMVELPLAMPVLMAGLRTATVWTIGMATLSTYIGAGGLGDFISRGLARNDATLTMLGALPAAAMAVAFSLILRRLERRLGWS